MKEKVKGLPDCQDANLIIRRVLESTIHESSIKSYHETVKWDLHSMMVLGYQIAALEY